MRGRLLSIGATAILVLAGAAPVAAAPPTRISEPLLFLFPDFSLGLVILINTDRETYCTPEQVAWENAFLAWLDGGEVGEPPQPPTEPEGFDLVSIKEKETGRGAIVQLFKGSRLTAEIWELDADARGIGPCSDTDDAANRVGRGTARFMINDNDLFGSGTRGNAFGDRGVVDVVDEDGTRHRYSWAFHLNSRCFAPDDGPPACLIERSRFR